MKKQFLKRALYTAVAVSYSAIAGATSFTVSNTSASAATSGSLPWAVAQVNAGSGGGDTIKFSTTGVITLTATLQLSKPAFIDGSTAPGYAGVPLIEITNTASVTVGLYATTSGSNFNALSVTGFIDYGIRLSSSGNTVTRCYLGLTRAGTVLGNDYGIVDFSGGNTIGGINKGNVISGNVRGIYLEGSGDIIQGNIIGMNVAGTAAIPNSGGIQVVSGTDTIGGVAEGAGNYISGNTIYGISIQGETTLCTLQGNIIGMNVDGTAAVPNDVGVRMTSGSTIIGGTVTGARNYISGNTSRGISIQGTGSTVQGNIIGMNVDGTAAVSNGMGIAILSGTTTIGGTATGAGNYISGNTTNGVAIYNAGTVCTVEGNVIGMDLAGTAAVANDVGVSAASGTAVIGGTATGARNYISGNTYGIAINATGTTVQGNVVGMNVAGTSAVPNDVGIIAFAGTSTIGGTATGAGNYVSGNTEYGILLQCAGNVVQGNIVGMNVAGTSAVPNDWGILLAVGSNTIGGTATGAENYVSGNTTQGIGIQSSGNTVLGNIIGMNVAGTAAVPNNNGILILSGSSTIGGTAVGAGNYISGNTSHGIAIQSADNVIQGNVIGLNLAGNTRIPNDHGIGILAGASTVGGTAAGAGNYISGNTTDGIYVVSRGNTIKGNKIGLNVAGTAAVYSPYGINLKIGGDSTTIGGPGAGNIISVGTGTGIVIQTDKNKVQGNYIGTNATGTAALANNTSIFINSGADFNKIGGSAAGEGNLISGSTSAALDISGSGNKIQGNTIGLNATRTAGIPNFSGVIIYGSNDTLGGTAAGEGNFIAGNTLKGVNVVNRSGNKISGNAIYNNGSYGIDLGDNGITLNDALDADAGANTRINFPVITSVAQGGGNTTITGTYSGAASATFSVELFGNDNIDISGYGEGKTYLGAVSVTTNALGQGTFSKVVAGTYSIISATATDASGNTSEFSQTGPSFVLSSPGSLSICKNAAATSVAGLLHAIDAQFGQTLTWRQRSAPTHGTVSISSATAASGSADITPGGTITYMPTVGYSGTDAFTMLVTDGSASVTMVVNVTVAELPVINSISSNTPICAGADLSLSSSASGGTGALGYTWSGPAGFSATTTAASIIAVTANASGTYTLIVTDTKSCSDTANTAVMVSEQPVIGSVSNNGPVCAGHTFTLSSVATGAAAPVYTWSGPNTYAATGQNQTLPGAGVAASGIYTLVVTATGNCADTGTTTAVVNPNPVISVIGSNTPVCAFVPLNFTSTASGTGALSYAWSGPLSFSATTATTTIDQPNTDATGTYMLIVTDANNCGDTVTTNVTVNARPVNNIVTNNGPVCAGNTLTLTGAATGTSALTYVWTGPGAYAATGENQSIPNAGVSASGSYTLVVTDTNHCTATGSTEVVVNPSPVISAIGGTTAVCENLPLSLSSTITGGTPGYSYNWSGPDGFSSGDEDPVVTTSATVANEGIYELIAGDINGCTDTATTELIIYPLRPIEGATTVLFGQITVLSNAVAGGTWSTPTPWIARATAATGDVKGISAGAAEISYITPRGCVATTTITVLSGANVCVGQSIAISDGLTGGTWVSANGSIAGVGTTSGIITGVGAGKVAITHRTTTGIITTTITVNPLAATTAAPASVCQGQTLTLTNTTAGGGTWYSGNTATAAVSTTGIVTGTGGGAVTMYFTPQAGCLSSKGITIIPVTSITGSTQVCVGQTVNVSNSTPGGVWSTSAGALATVSASGLVKGIGTGNPRISYIWPSGCQAVVTATVSALSPITGGTAGMCQSGIMTLANATPFGGVWSSSNTLAATVSSTGVVRGAGVGTTTISFTTTVAGCVATRTVVTNACREAQGGDASPVTDVTAATEEVRLYPNPNNGQFTLSGTLADAKGDVTIEVVNMLGQVIYKNTTPVQDGNINARVELPAGIASGTYLLHLRSATGNKVFHLVVGQ